MKKLQMIRGSKERAEEIESWFENQGGKNVNYFNFASSELLYYINDFGDIKFLTENDVKGLLPFFDCEIVELPKKQPKHQFRPFEKVLVRDDIDKEWRCDLFSNSVGNLYRCVGCIWTHCIPYEGNEHLLGTKDNPKGGEG